MASPGTSEILGCVGVRLNGHRVRTRFLIKARGAGAGTPVRAAYELSERLSGQQALRSGLRRALCPRLTCHHWINRPLNVRCTLDCVAYRWLAQALALLSGIEPHEVLQVLDAERRMPLPAIAAGVRRLTISGRTRKGRPLIVAIRAVDPFDPLIVGGREMTADELARFEEWEAGR